MYITIHMEYNMFVCCRSPVTDSDEEDSAESSTDEEEEIPATGEEG